MYAKSCGWVVKWFIVLLSGKVFSTPLRDGIIYFSCTRRLVEFRFHPQFKFTTAALPHESQKLFFGGYSISNLHIRSIPITTYIFL